MRADAQTYVLAAATPVTIRGGVYAIVATGATGTLQMKAPDGSFVSVATSDTPGTPITLAGAACMSPIYLPAGSVQLASGSGWLVGIG